MTFRNSSVFVLIIAALVLSNVGAQETPNGKHGFLISAGGEGGIYTLGYEYQFATNKLVRPYIHAGLSAFPIDQRITFAFPLSAGVSYRRNNFDFMCGAGIGPNISYYYQQFSAGQSPSRLRFYSRLYAEAGCRYYFKDDKFSLGIKYSPLFSFVENLQVEHWGGITFGIHLHHTNTQ